MGKFLLELVVEAMDNISMSHIEIFIGANLRVTILDEVPYLGLKHSFKLTIKDQGEHKILVKAYDYEGNR